MYDELTIKDIEAELNNGDYQRAQDVLVYERAHKNRPDPFAIEMMLTMLAATRAVTCVISCAMGDAWEMMLIPAMTFKNSTAQSAYHCQVESASFRV